MLGTLWYIMAACCLFYSKFYSSFSFEVCFTELEVHARRLRWSLMEKSNKVLPSTTNIHVTDILKTKYQGQLLHFFSRKYFSHLPFKDFYIHHHLDHGSRVQMLCLAIIWQSIREILNNKKKPKCPAQYKKYTILRFYKSEICEYKCINK